jgi:uncharacterized membrane protein YeaQ/YmgE (transglycosylase-associated protein family)
VSAPPWASASGVGWIVTDWTARALTFSNGAFVKRWRPEGAETGVNIESVVIAVVGAIIVLFVWRALRGSRRS